MLSVAATTEFFFISLALGVGFFSFLCRPEQTGAGFLKVISAVTGVSCLIALIFHLTYASVMNPQLYCLFIAMTCSVLTYLFHRDSKTLAMWALYLIQNAALFWVVVLYHNLYPTHIFFFLSSALFLGVITYAMILGHWYLVVPKLSEAPLKKAMVIVGVLLLLKVILTAYQYHEFSHFFEQGSREGAGYLFNWVLLTMRVGWGYVVIGIMGYFTWRLVCMRSIQSATGILYAMTFFVIGAELVSQYIFFHYGFLL